MPLENHTALTGWDEPQGCPQHAGSKLRKIYTFGQYGDAEVATFNGCKCAVCTNVASLLCGPPLGGEITYHTSYSAAAGRAQLIKMSEAAANAPFA